MLNYSILRFTREQRHIYYWNRVSYRENIVNKKRVDKEVQGSERGKLRWRKREGGGREEEEEKEARDRSWYRNSHAKSITRRRCSEIVPSSATYSGHWYVLSLSPSAPFPSLSLRPEGCLVSSLLPPDRFPRTTTFHIVFVVLLLHLFSFNRNVMSVAPAGRRKSARAYSRISSTFL